MALVLSGALSMGGSTADRSINCELGFSGTAQISLDDADVRSLAGVPTGEIAIDDFYGASAGPTSFGEVYEGGYYMGTISAAGSSYYLIMSPNATGCSTGIWSGRFCAGSSSSVDGYGNTYTYLASASFPAANFAATRSINGFTDWYLPARGENAQLATNKNSAPAGQGFASGFSAREYWSSTEINYSTVSGMEIVCFLYRNTTKDSGSCRIRAMRREPI